MKGGCGYRAQKQKASKRGCMRPGRPTHTKLHVSPPTAAVPANKAAAGRLPLHTPHRLSGQAANEGVDQLCLRRRPACMGSVEEGSVRRMQLPGGVGGLGAISQCPWRSDCRPGSGVQILEGLLGGSLCPSPGLLTVTATAAGRRSLVKARANHFSTRSTFSRRRACMGRGARPATKFTIPWPVGGQQSAPPGCLSDAAAATASTRHSNLRHRPLPCHQHPQRIYLRRTGRAAEGLQDAAQLDHLRCAQGR